MEIELIDRDGGPPTSVLFAHPQHESDGGSGGAGVVHVLDRALVGRPRGVPILGDPSVLSRSGVSIRGVFSPFLVGIDARRSVCPLWPNSTIDCTVGYPDFPIGPVTLYFRFEDGVPVDSALIEDATGTADAQFEMSYFALLRQRAGRIDGIELLRGGNINGELEAIMCAGGLLNTSAWLDVQRIGEPALRGFEEFASVYAEEGPGSLAAFLASATNEADRP